MKSPYRKGQKLWWRGHMDHDHPSHYHYWPAQAVEVLATDSEMVKISCRVHFRPPASGKPKLRTQWVFNTELSKLGE
jgi:hypothetical protein